MSEICMSDTPWTQLLTDFEAAWKPNRWRNLGVVIGCSGGADSVALLRLVCELRRRSPAATGFVVAAHYNHGLRADASDGDQAFVADLARSLGVQFSTQGPPASPPWDEAAMRALRRDFFIQVAQQFGARYIATAHTADDNVETMLHHLMRGTGPPGLAGIASSAAIGPSVDARDFVLVRPMLSMSRMQIRIALESIEQSWREDESNLNTDYRRNWIRQTLIPLMQNQYPQAVDAMSRTIGIQSDWRKIVDRMAAEWLVQHRQNEKSLVLTRDPHTESAIIITAFQHLWDQQGWPRREMNAEHWRRLAETLRSDQPQRYDLPGNIEVVATVADVTFTRCGQNRTGTIETGTIE